MSEHNRDSKLLSSINMVGQTTPESGVKKIAIQKDGYFPILYDVKPIYTIEYVVKDICAKWTLSRPEQFALQHLDTKLYITEENRVDIRDGDLFTITYNAEVTAAKFLSDIEQPDLAIRRKALADLAGVDGAGQADDPLFAKEFINRNGVNTLVHVIESNIEPADIVARAMAAIQELFEHGFMNWEAYVSQIFVEKIIGHANKTEGADAAVVQRALSLLDNIVTVSTGTYYVSVMNKVNTDNLVKHLKNNNESIQHSTLALCNSILAKMEHVNRVKFSRDLSEKGYYAAVHKIIIAAFGKIPSGMAHQLYMLQALLIGLYQPKMNSKPDFNNQQLLSDLNNIYNIAFESAPNLKDRGSGKPDFTRLGFTHGGGPLIDFEECPPGILAYDVMLYFAENYPDQYIKIILENVGRDAEHECPFAKCSKQVTKVLCELLEVSAPLSDTSIDYQPMVFSANNIFEELYCVAIQLLNKTWKEMRATSHDLSRVVGVVKDQLKRVLGKKPDSIEKFKTEAFSLTYQSILRLMQREAQERNILDSQTKPVIELREQIEPEIKELVRQQRLAQLVEGTSFNVFSQRGKQKDKTWFCCLSSNHRFLHYSDPENSSVNKKELSPDSLPNKIPLSEVIRIDIGKDCLNAKNLKRGYLPLAFSVIYGQEEHLDFIAPNDELFSVWTDALSFLIGKETMSSKFKSDLDMLLNMEMKLLLLDLENVTIPDVPPSVPPEPDNYEFYYADD